MKEFDLPYFVYIGNAYPHKNLKRAILAILSFNSTSKIKILFLIVSSRNAFTNRLENLVNKLNAQKFVKVLGFVADEKLQKLYESSVGFIYPSLIEGFGLPGLEAMKAGTIVLASDIPVFREIYGSHAIYFNPKSVSSIKKAIEKTISLTKTEGDKIIRGSREIIKRYSWSKMAKETLEVYNSFK